MAAFLLEVNESMLLSPVALSAVVSSYLVYLGRRLASSSSTAVQDIIILLLVVCLRHRTSVLAILVTAEDVVTKHNFESRFSRTVSICSLGALCYLLRKAIFASRIFTQPRPSVVHDCVLKIHLLPSRTTHSRLSPVFHSFSYSYFYTGILFDLGEPLGRSQYQSSKIQLPSTVPICGSWFSIAASDYLARRHATQSFQQKLSEYLTTQKQDFCEYQYAYLVTVPRIFGFAFNPVSFWYLYSKQGQLRAMILEVNNTFDEKRMYFLQQGACTKMDEKQRKCFYNSWQKDFHVSPFNGRQGYYQLKAEDPLASDNPEVVWIDNTIVLSCPEEKSSLVARVFSVRPAIDGQEISSLKTLLCVCMWSWVGLTTNLRILREAWKLWMKNLAVFTRPEVLKTSIGRNATREEDSLAEGFFVFLKWLQKRSSTRGLVAYTAAAGETRECRIDIASGELAVQERPELGARCDFRVLTPAFYSQLVQYGDVAQAVATLCSEAHHQGNLAISSHPRYLLDQIEIVGGSYYKKSSQKPAPAADFRSLSQCYTLQLMRQSFTSCLLLLWPANMFHSRNLPAAYLPENSISLVDLAVFSDEARSSVSKRHYFRAAVLVIMAKHLSFGSTHLLHFYRRVLRGLLLLLLAIQCEILWLALRRLASKS